MFECIVIHKMINHRLTEEAHVSTTIIDRMCFVRALGKSSKETILKYSHPKMREWMDKQLSQTSRSGHKPWYGCPPLVLGTNSICGKPFIFKLNKL